MEAEPANWPCASIFESEAVDLTVAEDVTVRPMVGLLGGLIGVVPQPCDLKGRQFVACARRICGLGFGRLVAANVSSRGTGPE